MWPFFNPNIKVVTFRLCGWCVLGVFLLPAFTRLGHERQDLLSQCDEMHVCTDQTLVYTLIQRSFWGNGVWTHVNSKGKIPSTGKCPQRRIEPATLWTVSPSTTNWAILAPVFGLLCEMATEGKAVSERRRCLSIHRGRHFGHTPVNMVVCHKQLVWEDGQMCTGWREFLKKTGVDRGVVSVVEKPDCKT